MNKSLAKARIVKLKKELNRHRYLYHVLDKQEISDAAHDALKNELAALESEFPDLATADSPTQRVGGEPLAKFKKVRHAIDQWSFNDAFTDEEVKQFAERVKKMLKVKNFSPTHLEYMAELKIDGLHVVLTYEKGILVTGATRGDGKIGEDVTQNLRTIESIPLKLDQPVDIIVEGEVWLSKQQFIRLNKERVQKGEAEFANPRNAAAGGVRQLDAKITRARKLDCFIYDISRFSGLMPATQDQELRLLRELGFKTNPHAKLCSSVEEAISFWRRWEAKQAKEDYWLDGIVLKVNERRFQEILGYTGKAPRFALAVKFAPDQITTIVEDIKIQVGRTGALTPVAYLRPVKLAGSVVKRATLHNEDEIERLGLKINDTVIIQKAGDIIPEIVSVLPKLRTGNEKSFKMPKYCPICGSEAVKRAGEVAWYCVSKKCYAKNLAALTHFVAKNAFNIEGLGVKLIEKLMSQGLVRDGADIFKLKDEDLSPLAGLGEKSANNLITAIKQSKKIGLSKFINALGIRYVGSGMAGLLANYLGDLKRPTDFRAVLLKASLAEIEAVAGIGSKSAASIKAWIETEANASLLTELDAAGISFLPPAKNLGTRLKGKSFVITGTLASMSRTQAQIALEKLGAKISSQVSPKTTGLIVGKEPGGKLAKARKLKVRTYQEDEFLRLIA